MAEEKIKNRIRDEYHDFKYFKSKAVLFFIIIFLFLFSLNSTFSIIVSNVEIINSSVFVSKPFFVPELPEENKLPYYEVYVNDFKFESNDLSFYIPVNESRIHLKVIYLVNKTIIVDKIINFCNHDNICQDYEFDTCDDCAKDLVKELNNSMMDEVRNMNSSQSNIPNYYFYISIAVLIIILFVIYSYFYLNKKRNKKGNIAINVIILSAIGVVFLLISQVVVASNVGKVSKKIDDVISKTERLQICNQLYQKYIDDKVLLTILFYGSSSYSCDLIIKHKTINCNGLCSEFINQFDVKPLNMESDSVSRGSITISI